MCSNDVTVKPDGMHALSPHPFRLAQRLKNVTVEILECPECGEISVGWIRQEDTEDATDSGFPPSRE